MAEIHKLQAERQVANALNTRNKPMTNVVHSLLLSSPVLVWREGNTGQVGQWDGLFPLLSIEGETCTVELPCGPVTFCSTVVKPYYDGLEKDQENKPTQTQPQVTVLSPSATTPPKQGRGRPRKYPLLTATADIEVYI
jgi:hypothetical protein